MIACINKFFFLVLQPNRLTLSRIVRNILGLNLFKSAKSVQPDDLKRQLWSTRLYILCLCMTVFILTGYNSIHQNTKTVTFNSPSMANVEHWQIDSSIFYSLQCPCSHISSDYKELITLVPTYHQICSSVYISSEWVNGVIELYNNMSFIYFADFRASVSLFQVQQSLCTLATSTVSNALMNFNQSQLVTENLLTREAFINQMNSSVESFKQATTNEFLGLLHLLSNITQAHQYLSIGNIPFNVSMDIVPTNNSNEVNLQMVPLEYYLTSLKNKFCLCLNTTSCQIPAGIYANYSKWSLIYAPTGLFRGCSTILSLYVSTLECFYDTSDCLNKLDEAAETHFFSSFRRLDSLTPSRFQINTTIGTLLENLFIEYWTADFS